jgi:hypothetical protein
MDYGLREFKPLTPTEGDTFTYSAGGFKGKKFLFENGKWVLATGETQPVSKPGFPAQEQAPESAATKATKVATKKAAPLTDLATVLQGAGVPAETVAALVADQQEQKALEEQAGPVLAAFKKNGIDLTGIKQSIAAADTTGNTDASTMTDLDAVKIWLSSQRTGATPTAAPSTETTPTDETGLDVGDGGGGTAPMTAEEKELQGASVLMSLMAEKGTRQRASVEELGTILDKWIDVLKGSVTPEQLKISEERARTGPGSFKGVEINLEPERQRALALGKDLGADMPELQRVLKQILPGFQGGGWSWNVPVTPEGVYGLLGETDPYGNPYGPVTDLSDWEQEHEQWAQGESAPSTQQAFMQMWGGGNPAEIGLPFGEGPGHFGYTQPGEPGYRQDEAGRQADQTAQTNKEITEIRAQADIDIQKIAEAGDQKAAEIYAAAQVKAAQLSASGQQAAAAATIQAAHEQAQAAIETAQIDAQARKDVAAMQEQGAKERLGAQLGADWATMSQQMAANPRDYLALAFRQSGQGIPSSLQNYLQPAGGAVPTTKGAPAGIQDILSQYLGQ